MINWPGGLMVKQLCVGTHGISRKGERKEETGEWDRKAREDSDLV